MDPAYVSEYTLFMREQLAKNPDWVEERRRGRAIWWERKTPLEEIGAFLEGRKHFAYPYDVNFKQD